MQKEIYRSMAYIEAKAETKAALAEYSYAASSLELARIRERRAELGSQSFVSIANGQLEKRFGQISDREREVGLAFARYVICGRTDEA